MFILEDYLKKLTESCLKEFGSRLVYIGLQGSYLRGEAGENSDIDIMTVIERLTVYDMDRLREILKDTGYFEKSCGFICGREELASWNPMEVCQLRFTTKDIFGTLEELLPQSSREDEINYVKMSLGNVYHEICHRYIHADREENRVNLPGVCKAMFFIIQNLHYLESGNFVLAKQELKNKAAEADCSILELSETCDDPVKGMSQLFEWCRNAFIRLEALT